MPHMTAQQIVTGEYIGVLAIIMGIDNPLKFEAYRQKLLDINEKYGDNYKTVDAEIAEFITLKNDILGIGKKQPEPDIYAPDDDGDVPF